MDASNFIMNGILNIACIYSSEWIAMEKQKKRKILSEMIVAQLCNLYDDD